MCLRLKIADSLNGHQPWENPLELGAPYFQTNPQAELYLRDGEMSEAAANEAVKVLNDSRRIEDSWVAGSR